MPVREFFRSLSLRLLAIPVSLFLVGALVPGMVGHLLLQRSAWREAHEKAVTLSATLRAVEQVAQPEAKNGPNGAGTTDASPARLVDDVVRAYQSGPKEVPFAFRRVAEQAGDGFEAAEGIEAGIVSSFAADTRLRQYETEVQRNGQRTLVYALPVIANGKTVGATIVYMPMGFYFAQAARIFWSVGALIGLLAFLCSALLALRVRKHIAKPAAEMLATSQAIRRGDWNARYQLTTSDELARLAGAFQETTRWLRERLAHEEKMRAMFQQFIPASVAAKALGKDADRLTTGTRHAVTVMMINIRNFKLLMDHLPPDQTVSTLNEYFSEVNKVIVANKGLVSKYLGDSIVAMFGMPVGTSNQALDAVKAAVQIPQALQNLYVRLDEEYGWQLGVGIGITTGEPIVGHFGSSEHMEYTCLGDVVVHANWLEELSKAVPEEDTTLIDEPTYRRVMSEVHVFDLGEKTTASGHTIHAFAVQGLRMEARQALAA